MGRSKGDASGRVGEHHGLQTRLHHAGQRRRPRLEGSSVVQAPTTSNLSAFQVSNPTEQAIYTITLPQHPAYPMIVHRVFHQTGRKISIEMDACPYGDKAASLALYKQFHDLDAKAMGQAAKPAAAPGRHRRRGQPQSGRCSVMLHPFRLISRTLPGKGRVASRSERDGVASATYDAASRSPQPHRSTRCTRSATRRFARHPSPSGEGNALLWPRKLNYESRRRRFPRLQLRSRLQGRGGALDRFGGGHGVAHRDRVARPRRFDRAAGRLCLWRLSARRRDGGAVADHGGGEGSGGSRRSRCWASAMAFRSCARRTCCRAPCCATQT